LQAAAAAATTAVDVRVQDSDYHPAELYFGAGAPIKKLYGSRKVASVEAWLKKHGSRVSHLSIHNDCGCLGLLDLTVSYQQVQRLQLLSLKHCELHIEPALLQPQQKGETASAEAQAPAEADAPAAAAGLAPAPATALTRLSTSPASLDWNCSSAGV
jgi:hypothetical protein